MLGGPPCSKTTDTLMRVVPLESVERLQTRYSRPSVFAHIGVAAVQPRWSIKLSLSVPAGALISVLAEALVNRLQLAGTLGSYGRGCVGAGEESSLFSPAHGPLY